MRIPALPTIRNVVLRVPLVRVRRSRWVLVPRRGSLVTLVGPRRFICSTNPPLVTRRTTSRREVVRLRLGDARKDPEGRIVQLMVANGLGRLAAYSTARRLAFWGPTMWLLGALAAVGAAWPLARRPRT